MQPFNIVNETNPLDTSAPVQQETLLDTSSAVSINSISDTPRNNTIMYIAIAIAVVIIIGLFAVILKSHKAKKAGVFVKPDVKKPEAAKAK